LHHLKLPTQLGDTHSLMLEEDLLKMEVKTAQKNGQSNDWPFFLLRKKN
jgi:hypothetical protein